MQKNNLLQPFLKWAGGKRQLIPEIRKYLPKKFKTYFEPFVGGGAILFEVQPKSAVINDINVELCNCYNVIRDNIDELIIELRKHKNEVEYYYRIRDLDRNEHYSQLNPVERASRIIFLNKTCYNGLFRVNSQGQFNVPFGRYKNPKILDEIVLRAVSNYLKQNKVTILNTDFENALKNAKSGDFIYLDPPYDPMSDTSSFTGYNLNGFIKDDQIRLKETFIRLDRKGCNVMLSNSSTLFIQDLYKEYKTVLVAASRAINSVPTGRGKIDEVLVMNYE